MNGVYTELAEVNYELFYAKQTQSNPIPNPNQTQFQAKQTQYKPKTNPNKAAQSCL